jgi:hypothetical protein
VAAPLLATHPMDALTPDEITASAKILRAAGKLGDNVRIVSLSLEENPKAEVRAWTKGQPRWSTPWNSSSLRWTSIPARPPGPIPASARLHRAPRQQLEA